jgi:hypothetical protein
MKVNKVVDRDYGLCPRWLISYVLSEEVDGRLYAILKGHRGLPP